MKTVKFWAATFGMALLWCFQLSEAREWRASISVTHTIADVLMYWWNLLLLVVFSYWFVNYYKRWAKKRRKTRVAFTQAQ